MNTINENIELSESDDEYDDDFIYIKQSFAFIKVTLVVF